MDTQREPYGMLDLLLQPAFCVKENTIRKVNPQGQALLIAEGAEVNSLLLTGAEEYAAFQGGCLYVQLTLSGQSRGASVTRVDDADVFVLDPDTEDSQLRAMALAARELYRPLSSLIAISDGLLPGILPEGNEKTAELLARMSRGLYQMQRILGNMSDAGQIGSLFQPEYRNITQIFDDIFEKASALLETAGIRLSYEGPRRDIFGLIDGQQMERAVLNILSNALKFTGEDRRIQAVLKQRGSFLLLSIQDNGEGIGQDLLGSLFSRYLRQPSLEDNRFGLGLGMVLVRAAAANHGGAVLIDQPAGQGTRVSLTMKLCREIPSRLCSPISTLSGGRDQALIELSEFLPLSIYEKEQ